jgi:hypothetical protein
MSMFITVRVEFLHHPLTQSILGAELCDSDVDTGETVGLKESWAFQIICRNREFGWVGRGNSNGRWHENVLVWGSRLLQG